MKRRACALMLAVGLLGLSGEGAGAQSLKIGVIAPMTGAGAQWGMAAKMAGEIAAAEVNAKGGLAVGGKSYKVGIITYDDQYKAAEAVAAYNRLQTQDGVRYVVIATSAPTLALKQTIEDDKVIGLTTSYTPAAIDAKTKFMFRAYSTSADFLPPYVEWMKTNLKEKRLVVINPNDETGWSQKAVTESVFRAHGFEVVGGELYERSIKDFQPVLTKILALNPEIIDLGSSAPASAGLIVRQARELGYKGRFVQTGGAGWAAVVDVAGKAAAEGLVNILYADPGNKGYQHLVAEYRKQVGQAPNEIIAPYYDAITVLMKAIQSAGDVDDTTKVAAAMSKVLPMASLQGDEMTAAHQQIRTYNYVGVLKDGAPEVVGKVK